MDVFIARAHRGFGVVDNRDSYDDVYGITQSRLEDGGAHDTIAETRRVAKKTMTCWVAAEPTPKEWDVT